MDNFERLRASTLLQKRLAKYIVRVCFRDNTILEGLHADPDSRLDQAEMRALMMGAVQNCYTVIGHLLNVYDGRPGLKEFMGFTALVAGMAAGNPTPMTNLLDALEACDFNPEWNEPKDGEERARRRQQNQGRKKEIAPAGEALARDGAERLRPIMNGGKLKKTPVAVIH